MRVPVLAFNAAVMLCLCCLAASWPAAEAQLKSALEKPAEWFKSPQGRRFADNIISWQNPEGGWWKEYDPKIQRPAEAMRSAPGIADDRWLGVSTFDNSATYTEIRLLARAFAATSDPKYRQAFDRALKFVFEAQYPNGGWPQRFPLRDDYGRHITFNDKLMSSVMQLLLDVSNGAGDFAFVEEPTRRRAREAFDRGVECILKMQIKDPQGRLTGWCQQHDAKTLEPTSARTYELPSIASFETADVVLLLMNIEKPDERVKQAIVSAAEWFDRSKITGKKYERINDSSLPYGVDRRLSDDPSGQPIWARFYEIETNKPIFADRDGVKRYNWSEVGEERRAKYAWYGDWGNKVLAELREWKKRVGVDG